MRMLSPRELADALGVSESSLKRWVDAGKLHAARTEGGHRRIALAEALRFIRASGAPVARPDLLDMPEVGAEGNRADATFLHHLVDGDARAARGWLVGRYLEGQAIADLCDGPIRAAMQAIGERWLHESDGVFVEHRAMDACLRAVTHLHDSLEPAPDAPVAVTCGPEDDPYLLGPFMCAMVAAAAGMRAVNLGPDTPLQALQEAVQRHQPRLVCLSVSSPIPSPRARAIARWLVSLPARTRVLVGGRHVAAIANAEPSLPRGDSMAELAQLAARITRTR